MDPYYHLGWVDYVVIGLTLVISTAIGITFQFTGNRQKTTREYLLAGKNMSIFPVVMSITVTMLSAVTIIGTPMETYRFGLKFALLLVPFSIGTVLAALIITPVYFNCRVSTTYEFLEIRYGKTTRYAVSALFILQMVLFMSVVLYAPVLALSAVTDLSIEASIIVFGLVCSFYCAVGGLKGVLWTDVFQSALMFLCLVIVYVFSVQEAGGVTNVYKTSSEGQRLDVFDFSVDFTTRFTILNIMAKGIVGSMAFYGTSQVEVQRLLSLSTIKRAQWSLCCSVIPVAVLYLMCNMLGLVMFTIFKDCDPILDKANTGIAKYDQVIPYYIVTRLHSIPGLTGLCIAGIFSGSLSTISSALNSLSTVTVIDFIKPMCKTEKLSDTRVVYIAKALSILFGILCICFAFAVAKVDSLVAVNNALIGITEGPMLAIYLVGILSRKGTQKCILFGLIVGFSMTGWIGYGIVFSGYHSPSLPVDSSGCSSLNSTSIFQNVTSACDGLEQCAAEVTPVIPAKNDPFILYKISFMWIAPIGLFFTLCAVFFAILVTGSWRYNVIPANSKCLSPITKLWIRRTRLHEPPGTPEEQAALTTMNGFERTIEVVKI
ncbi:putative sodium-dependent multivitamin transporter [Argiope bruennichi]|uniref:putative sodium-dependent multivitamin transporter n=1 Tax=Argiope bruennichi TaxID=94029 RepID=UPI0024941129|nr:putative sodium-dependent multivitamin transporter [Argiope bruennichi]